MFSFFQQGPRKSLERDANTAPTQDSSKREMMANLSKRTSVEGRDANTREKDTKESKLTNDPTNQPASSNKSSGKTKKEKKSQSNKLVRVKRQTFCVFVAADIILAAALLVQILSLQSSLFATLETKVDNTSAFMSYQYNQKLENLRLGALNYAMNISTSAICQSIQIGDEAYKEQAHVRMANEQQNRRVEFFFGVDRAGAVVAGAIPTSARGQLFNPSGILDVYMSRFASSGKQLMTSLLVDESLFSSVSAPEYGTGDNHINLNLDSYRRPEKTLCRFIISPLFCATNTIQGFHIIGDAITPRIYDTFSSLANQSKGGFTAVLTKQPGGSWATAYSYLVRESGNDAPEFPLVHQNIDQGFLESAYGNGGQPMSSQITLGDDGFVISVAALPESKLGDQVVNIPEIPVAGVYVFGIRDAAVHHTVNVAIAWHVPFAVFMLLLGIVTMQMTVAKLITPMEKLIESVKQKRLKEFNETIRRLKANKAVLFSFLSKALFVQSILLGLVFINRALIQASVADFTSASSEGLFMHDLTSTKAHNMEQFLNGWAGFDFVAAAARSGVSNDIINTKLKDLTNIFNVEFVAIVNSESIIIASSYQDSVGSPMPILPIVQALADSSNTSASPSLVTTDLWTHSQFNSFAESSPQLLASPLGPKLSDAPVVIRLVVASITDLIGGTIGHSGFAGVLVAGDAANGKLDIWDPALEAFRYGYFGMYAWDKRGRSFKLLSSVSASTSGDQYGTNLNDQGILSRGMASSFSSEGIYVEQDVPIQGMSMTASVVPVVSSDETTFNDWVFHAYIIRGVNQTAWTKLIENQLVVQLCIMAVEMLTSAISLVLTYLPMRNFLSALERAFNVPSMSLKDKQRQQDKAAAALERLATSKPDTEAL